MPAPIVAGNWKMNTSIDEALTLVREMLEALGALTGVEKVLCPPFISLEPVCRLLQDTSIKLGAQNMHHQERGAFTGEISPTMIASLCQYVILGHSERRQHFGETDQLINLKVKAAFEAGVRPILCVGETLEQRQQGKAAAIVSDQLKVCLDSLHNISELAVAYEPVWAIGTGVAANPETASAIMGGVILPMLVELYGESAQQVPLLYGGSVTSENVEGFLEQKSVQGALVGGASLQAGQFVEIARITARAKRLS